MDQRDSEDYFKSFYVRRCCRILPPYLLVLTSYVILKFVMAAHYASTPWYQELFLAGGMPLWANFTLTQNFVQVVTHYFNSDWLNVTWSLVLEEQFYMILPLAIWLLPPPSVVRIGLVLAFLNPLLEFWLCLCHPAAYIAVSGLAPERADALLVGLTLAYLLRQDKVRTWIGQNVIQLKVIFIVLLAGDVYCEATYARGTCEYERILFFNLWIAVFYAFLLLLAMADKNGIVARLTRFSPLRNLGIISYTVYLFHMPINGLLHGLLLGRDRFYHESADAWVTVLALIVIVLFATASWCFMEKPIVSWGHSFLYRKPG